MTRLFRVLIFCLAATACSRGGESEPQSMTGSNPISLALVNARVWTGDPSAPWAEALAVSGDRLVAVGTNDAVRNLATR